ncbi:hypothetical protein LSAT2_020887 [Lamellibrachia satsuma]|nr:hypothetical protein LSAT2_020887 [Lamellibrachia satsuma]
MFSPCCHSSLNCINEYLAKGDRCWLSRDAFYGGLLAPVGAIIIVNCIVFVLVMRQLHSAAHNKLTQARHTSTTVHLQRAASVMVLLGLTWAFAFFAIGGASVVFHYLFAIFNSLQGLFIFIFYCATRKDVQQGWKEMFKCSTKSTSNSSSSKGTSGQTASSQLATNRFKAVGNMITATRHMRSNIEQKYAVRVSPTDEHPTTNFDNTQKTEDSLRKARPIIVKFTSYEPRSVVFAVKRRHGDLLWKVRVASADTASWIINGRIV